MSYPAISLATATVGRHRCPQKRLQTAPQPPGYPNSSPDHRACNSLTPFRCPHAVHPCPSVDSGLGKMATAEKLLEWEAFYDRYVGPRYSFVALCQYDHNRFGGSSIMYALQTHPLSIIGNIVQENPFYRDPEEVLEELSPSKASRTP